MADCLDDCNATYPLACTLSACQENGVRCVPCTQNHLQYSHQRATSRLAAKPEQLQAAGHHPRPAVSPLPGAFLHATSITNHLNIVRPVDLGVCMVPDVIACVTGVRVVQMQGHCAPAWHPERTDGTALAGVAVTGSPIRCSSRAEQP